MNFDHGNPTASGIFYWYVIAADAGYDLHFVKPVSVRDLIVALDERVIRGRLGAR